MKITRIVTNNIGDIEHIDIGLNRQSAFEKDDCIAFQHLFMLIDDIINDKINL